MDDLSRFCCLNASCPRHGQRGQGNLAVRARYGPGKSRRLLYCKACKRRFSERQGTPLFDCRLPEPLAQSVLAHLQDGCGVRQTGRLVGVHRNTVVRLSRQAGEHAQAAHDELVGCSPSTTRLQLDEKWSFVAKKERHCDWLADEDDMLKGDQWDFVALDPDSRLVLSALVGKRLLDNAVLLLEDARGRLGGRVPQLITSDEWAGYAEAIKAVFGEEVVPPRTGRPGRPAGPRKEVPAGLNHATVHKARRKGRVVGVVTRVVLGLVAAVAALLGGKRVSTCYVERHNATDRLRNARKGRKTYRFSKDLGPHEALTHFTMYSYNFCWPVRTLRKRTGPKRYEPRTPAMAAGLADHVWSLREWLTFPACQRQ
jgi:transposase-like protein